MLQLNKKKTGDIVGLDIEAGSVAAAEVKANGTLQVAAAGDRAAGRRSLPRGRGHRPRQPRRGAEVAASPKNKLSKRVRLGIGNQRVVVRTLRLPAIEDREEMEAAVRFQAQEQIPMPLDQAVLEHQVVGGVPAEEGAAPQVDVVVVAARRDMVSSFLEPIRRAGLEPVGIDLSAFGMIRALAGVDPVDDGTRGAGVPGAPGDAVLYCNVGDVMNLAVARGRSCLFTRVSNIGMESISGRVASETGLNTEHAAQWLAHVGLERPAEEIEGDPQLVATLRRVLHEGVRGFIDELRLSLDYYGAQESAVPVSRVVLCGPGSAIAGLAPQMEEQLGLPIGISPSRRPLRPGAGRRRPPHPAIRTRPGRLSDAPDNLIPPEDREGQRAPLRTGPIAYIVIGALVLVLVGVAALVLTNNQIADRTSEVTRIEREDAAATAEAQRLAAYTQLQALH